MYQIIYDIYIIYQIIPTSRSFSPIQYDRRSDLCTHQFVLRVCIYICSSRCFPNLIKFLGKNNNN